MRVLGRMKYSRLAIIGAALAAVFMMGHFAQAPALADNAAQMSLSVSGCAAAECDLDLGETFTVSIEIEDAPDEGYVLVQSFIDYGPSLTYNMTDSAADEILWPDASSDVVVRESTAPGTVLHGGLTGVIPPLPQSTYEGAAFEIELQCSDAYSSSNVQLLPSGDEVAGTSGAVFTSVSTTSDGVEETLQIIPKVNSVTVNCGQAPPPGQPTDGGLPSSGTGSLAAGSSGSSVMLWLVIGALLVAGTSLGAFGWRTARSRQI